MYLKEFFKKIHIKQWVNKFLPVCDQNRCPSGQGGFLLLSMVGMILLLSAAYTSFAFVAKKQFNWDLNYALGQQYAQVARAAHLYVQSVAYAPQYAADPQRPIFLVGAGGGGNVITIADLIAEGFLPAGFDLNDRKYDSITIRAYGDRAPRGGAPNSAPTAFVIIDIDVAAGRRRNPSELAGFRAGAAAMGMSRMGFVPDTSPDAPFVPDTRTCGLSGNNDFVRWGDNPNDCLTVADVEAITNSPGITATLDENDVIAPAWEVVNESEDVNAVYRYPQPNRPDAQVMNADVNFYDGAISHSITQANYMDANNVSDNPTDVVPSQMTINGANANNPNGLFGALSVTDAAVDSVLDGDVVITQDLSTETAQVGANIAPGNDSMVIGNDMNIATGGLVEPAGQDATLTVATEIGIVSQLSNQAGNRLGLTVQNADGTGPLGDLVVTGSLNQTGAGPFVVQGNGVNQGDLQASFASVSVCGVGGCTFDPVTGALLTGTARDINVTSSATGKINADDVSDVTSASFGSLTAGSGAITVEEEVTIQVECYGSACPDALTEAPDDPF